MTPKVKRRIQRLEKVLHHYRITNNLLNRWIFPAKVEAAVEELLYYCELANKWLENHYDEELRVLLYKAENSGVMKYDPPPKKRKQKTETGNQKA